MSNTATEIIETVFQTSDAAHRAAYAEHAAITAAYRAGEVDDSTFLASREKQEAILAVWDAAYAACLVCDRVDLTVTSTDSES